MSDKIELLLSFLASNPGNTSISELAAVFQHSVTDRTIRRWLSELIDQGLVETQGQYKSTRYQLTAKGKERARELSQESQQAPYFSEASITNLQKVQRPLLERDPCSYNQAWLDAYEPNTTFYLSEARRQQLADNSLLTDEHQSSHTYTKNVFNRLLIGLSYNSSRLEGNTYSLLETQQLVLQGEEAHGKQDAEKLMILNHKDAISFLVEGVSRVNIDSDSIKTLHFLLADGLVMPQAAGHIREEGVRITLTPYVPIENKDHLERLLQTITAKAQQITDPFEQSLFLLVHISYLQAFIDVNKRTARLSANIPLIKSSLVPLAFNDIDKDDYISAMLCIYEYNDTGPLTDLYVFSYLRTCKEYKALNESLDIDVIRVAYRDQWRGLICQIINDQITGAAIATTIHDYAKAHIPAKDRQEFEQRLLVEIQSIERFAIQGLGISLQAFEEWQQLNKTYD
tara:strand:+ start:312 stop:1679 length:1368 start_codon:yes stop_codon:yes gene_type:complete